MEPAKPPKPKAPPKPPKAPAKTNAQRQADYRSKVRKDDSVSILNTTIDVSSKQELELLAGYFDVTQKQLIEQLIKERYKALLKGFDERQKSIFLAKELNIHGEILQLPPDDVDYNLLPGYLWSR